VSVADDGIKFYLAYLVWDSRMVRGARALFMNDFADWFVAAAQTERDDADSDRDALRSYLAAAF
jgi:hypothetical protein